MAALAIGTVLHGFDFGGLVFVALVAAAFWVAVLTEVRLRSVSLTTASVIIRRGLFITVVQREEIIAVSVESPYQLVTRTKPRWNLHGPLLHGYYSEVELAELAKRLGVPGLDRDGIRRVIREFEAT